ncbi:MAG TPA: glycosyltransferase [Roseiflexaceae bacterium]|nr:glycosyltransferase [Roseiflexaceae bacterium]
MPHIRFVYYDLGAPTRYRVHHHAEQARLAGWHVSLVPIAAWRAAAQLKDVDLIYIHRLPLSQRTVPVLAAARRAHVPVVFDSDDLVWDARERHYNYLAYHYTRREIARMLIFTLRMRLLMQQVRAFVFSTDYLAHLARQIFRQPAFVHQNALSADQLAHSAAAHAIRVAHDSSPVIGYFSGTPRVHDEDMATVAPALAAVLRQEPQARLRFAGDVALANELSDPALAAQIERRDMVHWQQLPGEIAGVGINIAPLVDNPQRRAKSAIKYLEAAAVGVPTVAVDMEPYNTVMRAGETGLLASDPAAWEAALLRLARDPSLRQTIGECARADVLAHHTNEVRVADFVALMNDLLT